MRAIALIASSDGCLRTMRTQQRGSMAAALACAIAGFACAPAAETGVMAPVALDGVALGGAARGERIYGHYCAPCHGTAGDGRGPAAKVFGGPPPRDFTTGVYEFRSTANGQLPLHADLARTVRRGIPGTTMPAWGSLLPPADVDAVVDYVQAFSPRFAAKPESSRRVVAIPTPPARSPDAVARGRAVYLLMKCWDCHGTRGDGRGPSTETLKRDDGGPISALDFGLDPFKRGSEVTDIYRTFVTGLDGTPMPSYLQSMVITRELGDTLGPLAELIDPGELAAVKAFVAGQLPAEQFYALDPEAQESRAQAWRWDLAFYVQSLRRSRPWWRVVLGI